MFAQQIKANGGDGIWRLLAGSIQVFWREETIIYHGFGSFAKRNGSVVHFD